MKKNILFLFAILLLLTACSSSKDYFIVSEYEGKKINEATLFIPTLDEFKIRHTDNIFTEDELAQINKIFVSTISNNLRNELKANSTFRKIEFANFGERLVKEKTNVAFHKDEVKSINLPKMKLPIEGEDKAFILLIDNVSLAIFKKEMDTSDPAKFYSATPSETSDIKLSPMKFFNQMFSCEFNFAIYDNNNGKPVSYGLIAVESKMEENLDLDKILIKIVQKMAKAVLNDSPFEG